MSTIQVVIIEDQQQTREMLSVLVNGTEGYQCVAAFENGEKAIAAIPGLNVDVALVDIHLAEGISGTECVRQLKIICTNVQFIMCTSLEDPENIFLHYRQALQAISPSLPRQPKYWTL